MELKRKNVDMTVGNPIKVIVLFTLPLLLGNLFQQLYNIIDSIVVGNFVGDEALAAVSSSGSLINLLIGLVQGITVGAGIVIAQYYGAHDVKKMRSTIHTTIIFALILGAILTVTGYFLSQELLILMNTDESVLPLSTKYFKTYFLGCVFTLMYNAGSSIFRAVGDSKRPLYFLIISSIFNVLCDLLFVGVFKWGVIGAGVATIVAQAISMILTFYKLFKDKTEYQVKFKELKIDFESLKKIIAYGLPTGIQNSIISLSNVFVQSNINSFGPIAQAGCGAYSKIEGFATLPSGSFSMALSTYVGQNIGANKTKRALRGGMLGLLLSMLVTEILGCILFIFAPYLIGMFSDTKEVMDVGTRQAHIIVLFYFLLAFSHGMSGILRGAGYSKTPMFTMIICWVVVRITLIPVALSIPGWNNLQTIFWFYPFTWSLSFIVLSIMFIFVYNKKVKNDIISIAF